MNRQKRQTRQRLERLLGILCQDYLCTVLSKVIKVGYNQMLFILGNHTESNKIQEAFVTPMNNLTIKLKSII